MLQRLLQGRPPAARRSHSRMPIRLELLPLGLGRLNFQAIAVAVAGASPYRENKLIAYSEFCIPPYAYEPELVNPSSIRRAFLSFATSDS
jgi:hypothetical protein